MMIPSHELALTAIQKKLVGKKITYKEIYALMDEIAHERLGDILTTYFAASGYSKGFTHEELYYFTKAMSETGERLNFSGIVADKHSIGGVPGTRTTLIVVPIIAAAGFTIPKSSSRAITTPDGTADDMEVLCPVTFDKKEIYRIVKETHGCIVWGGSVNIAPADDILIHVEKPLMFENYDKIIMSIMAKKIAFGSNHVVIDLPYGQTMKVHRFSDALIIKEKFLYVAKKFHIKLEVLIHETHEPAGRGIGPVLEIKESLKVLEQDPHRPLDLEHRSLNLAGTLLDLCLSDSPKALQEKIQHEFGTGRQWAQYILESGQSLQKFQDIIRAQGGNPHATSSSLSLAPHTFTPVAKQAGEIRKIHNLNLTKIAKILGAPIQKKAGIYLHKKVGDKVSTHAPLYTMYSESMYNLKEAKESIRQFPIMYL